VTWSLDSAVVAAGIGLVSGWFVPALIARLPEPEPDPVPGSDGAVDGLLPAENEAEFSRPVDEPKELYTDLARLPGLPWKMALTCAVAAGLVGARLGWTPALGFLLYLVPVAVALAVVDWRTRYLPSRLIVPSYAVVAVLVTVASLLNGPDWLSLRDSAIGWVGSFVVFFVMWFVTPRSMAYGDVRLAGLLGMSLGWLGLAQVVLAMFTSFLLLAVGGVVLSVVRVFHSRHVPFGPFLVVGAFLAVTFPLQLLTAYAGVVNGLTSLVVGVLGS
jgi:leader peptidase (prepilin peptidase) / N-methyltransferase